MNRVYFLGGSPGSGKTTFTDTIHRNLGVAVYHTDDIFLTSNVTKNKQPHMFELRELSNPLDIWKRSPQSCLDFWIKYYEEAFGILMEDLHQKQGGLRPFIAEGVCILPHFLEKLNYQSNAYFLISCHLFLEEAIAQKLKQIPASLYKNESHLYENMLYTFSGISQIMIEDCKRANFPYFIMQNLEDYSVIYQKILNQFSSLEKQCDETIIER